MATPVTTATDGDKYLKEFAEAVRNRRAEDFYDKLREVLKPDQLTWLGIDKLEAEKILVPNPDHTKLENDKNKLLLAAFHYTSPSIGKWHRVLLEPPDPGTVLNLKPLELAQHGEAYDKTPMDINIPVSKRLREHLWIKVGDAPGSSDPSPKASLSFDQRQQLQKLFDDFGNRQFYDLILGLNKVNEDTISKVQGALADIRDLVFPDDQIRTDASDRRKAEQERDELTWRAFVFSFFLAIRLHTPAWVLVLPLRDKGLESFPGSETPSWPPATYVAALKEPPADFDFVKTARDVLLPIVRMLMQVELHAMETSGSPHVVVFENTVRLCTMIDERVLRDVNEYRRCLTEKLKKLGVTKTGVSTEKGDPLEETLNMRGGDPGMVAILEQLYHAARSGTGKKGLKPGMTFFLHSEPGCGKERLAHLCHLFSPRAEAQQSEVVGAVRDLWKRDDLERLIGREKATIGEEYRQWPRALLDASNFPSNLLRRYPSFGYASFNAGLLNDKNFDDAMCGSEETAGQLYRADLLRGTLFLDEYNTLEPKLANQLLRAFEEPYQIVIKKKTALGDLVSAEQKINVQVVFGSNKSPDELLNEGFNSAVVFRVAKQPLRIPPLRQRKVDIAIFVNGYFVNHNEDLAKKGKEEDQLRRVSLEGLRVICELPWPDNYRGVKGLLDDILQARAMRGVRGEKGREVSFDEVIQAVVRGMCQQL